MKQYDPSEVVKDPRYQTLVRTRSLWGWFLTSSVLIIYFGFITIVAFHKDLLGTRIGDGVTTVSIPVGIGVILFTVMVTGIYIFIANRKFDSLTAEIQRDFK